MDDLVKGGQGRSAEDIEDSAMMLAVSIAVAVVAFVGIVCGGLF